MADLVGSTIGDYRLEEFLGAGGMGEVYRGVHLKIGRVAAIKVLTASGDPGFTERFLNEARIQAELHHPNIATLYEFTEHLGRPCIVMEYVDGETVADRIRRSGRIPPDQTLAVFLPVAAAVGYVHDNGIVHRDIKSRNIKVSSRGTVKLLDFGIARGAKTPRLTLAGQFVGTLHYCSPEQLRGEQIDRRSDIWALGILLYEMLVGEVPFDAPSVGEFVSLVERGAHRPPSSVVADVPTSLDEVVRRCLERQPERRFQSAARIAEAASAAVSGRSGPGTTRKPLASGAPRALETLRRHAVLAWAGASLAVLTLLAVALVPWGRTPPQGGGGDPAAPRSRAATHVQSVSISLVGARGEVWVDRRRVGPTPCRFDATVGDKVDLELRVPGYGPLRRTIEILPHSNSYTYSVRDLEPR